MVTVNPLSKQLINISLAGGLEAKTDAKQVQPPQTLVAENVDYTENRNLKKRNGATFISGGIARGTPQSLLSVDDKLIIAGTGGLNVLSGGKWGAPSAYSSGYDNSVRPFTAIPVGPSNDISVSGITTGPIPASPVQPPAAAKFADINGFRLMVVESRHMKTGTGLTPIVYADSGAVARYYLIEIATNQIIEQGVLAEQYCRDVNVCVLGTNWYVSYCTRTKSEVLQLTGPTSSVFVFFGTFISGAVVCTGSHVQTYSTDSTAFSDMRNIDGRLYHAVTVGGTSQVVVSVITAGTASTLVRNVSWFSGPATQICIAGVFEFSNTWRIYLGNYKRIAAFNHTGPGATTTPQIADLPSGGRYLTVPFDMAQVSVNTLTSKIYMTDGAIVRTATYTSVSTVLTDQGLSNLEVEGSTMVIPTSDPLQSDLAQSTYIANPDAVIYPGGLYAQLRSRIFLSQDGKLRAWVAHTDGKTQSVDLLLRVDGAATTPITPDASMLYNSVSIIEVHRNTTTPTRGVGMFIHGHPGDATQTTFYETVNTSIVDQVYTLYRATYAPTVAGKRTLIRVPGGALQTGSVPAYWDGQSFASPGKFNAPVFPLTAIDASGKLDPTQIADDRNLAQPQNGAFEYTYFAVYVAWDANSRQMYGPVSPPFKVTVTSPNDAVQFGSAIARYLPRVQIFRNSYEFPGIYNRVRVQYDGSTYTDTGFDDKSSQLYAPPDGGELINDPLPPLSYAVSAVDRVYGIPSEAQDSIVWTKPFRDGRMIEYNADSRIVIAPASGPNVALGIIDSILFIFKRRQVYAMSIATAPDATGQGAFGDVALIASDVGCIDPNSLMLTPAGLFFRSERGLQIMTTGGAVEYAGAPVERLLQGRTIIDSTLVSAKNQCRFALSDGTILVYDHFLQRWSVYTGWAPQASTMHQGKYTFVTVAGQVCAENTGYQDQIVGSGTPAINYYIKVQSPWLALGAGLQGCGRIRRLSILGDYVGEHTLNVSFAYDYNPAWAYTVQCAARGKAQWVVRAPRQVAQAVSLQLTDVPGDSSLGQSLAISDINIELMAKSGVVRTPADRRL